MSECKCDVEMFGRHCDTCPNWTPYEPHPYERVPFVERLSFNDKGEPVGYARIVDREALKRRAGVYPQSVILSSETDLFIHGFAGDPIWCMRESEELIGVRLDSGDSGTVYLTNEQAEELAEQLRAMTSEAKSAENSNEETT